MKHLTTLAFASLLCIACRSAQETQSAPQSVHPAGEVALEPVAPEGSMEAVVERGDAPTAEALQAQAEAEYARLVADLSGPGQEAVEGDRITPDVDSQPIPSQEAAAEIGDEAERVVEAVLAPELEDGDEHEGETPHFLRAGAESAEWGTPTVDPVSDEMPDAIGVGPSRSPEEVEDSIEAFSQAASTATREAASAPPAPKAATSFDPAAMEARLREVATPGAQHRWLDALQGRWKAEVQYWMMPNSDPVASTGVMTNDWALDGRFLQMNYVGSMMGQPFQGFGHLGYDKVREQYVGYWVDSMGTQMMNVSTGVLSRDQKSLTLRRQALEPLTGKQRQVKEVLTIQSPDEHHWEMWGYAPDGTFFQMVRIVYRRSK